MEIHIQRFVFLYELFADFPLLFEAFNCDVHDFTWGDCDRSMIGVGIILTWASNYEADDDDRADFDAEYKRFTEALKALPEDVMIDLEN